MKPRNILITGGAGFIGSNLSQRLVQKGHRVTVLDNLSTQIHGTEPNFSELYLSIKDKVNFIKGSVQDRQAWNNSLKEQNIVIHLAAETGTGQSMYEISRYTDANISGTSILLDILANEEHAIEQIVVASSRAVYGEGKYECTEHGTVYPGHRSDSGMSKGDFEVKCPICGKDVTPCSTDENSKLAPSSVYGLTKQVQEQLCLIAGESLKIPTTALRFQNVYGPGQSLSNPYTGILSIFSNLLIKGQTINIFEDGTESRDFVYIDDVCQVIEHAALAKTNGYKVLNVGSGIATSVTEVAETLRNLYNSSSEIVVSGSYRLGDIRHNFADTKRLQKELGIKCDTHFSEGIQKFANWVYTQELPDSKYELSLKEMKEKGLFKNGRS